MDDFKLSGWQRRNPLKVHRLLSWLKIASTSHIQVPSKLNMPSFKDGFFNKIWRRLFCHKLRFLEGNEVFCLLMQKGQNLVMNSRETEAWMFKLFHVLILWWNFKKLVLNKIIQRLLRKSFENPSFEISSYWIRWKCYFKTVSGKLFGVRQSPDRIFLNFFWVHLKIKFPVRNLNIFHILREKKQRK